MQGCGAAEWEESTGAPELAKGGKAMGCKPRIWGAQVTASPSLPHNVGTLRVLLWGSGHRADPLGDPTAPPHWQCPGAGERAILTGTRPRRSRRGCSCLRPR